MRVYVFYDGNCPLCTRTARWLSRLDWFGRLVWISFRLPGVLERYNLDRRRAEARMQILHAGRLSEGFAALEIIARHVPSLWPFWPLLVLARWLGIGQSVYDWVARNRWRFGASATCDAACRSEHPESLRL